MFFRITHLKTNNQFNKRFRVIFYDIGLILTDSNKMECFPLKKNASTILE